MSYVATAKIHLEEADTSKPGYYQPTDQLPDDLAQELIDEFVKYGSAAEGTGVSDGPSADMTKIKAIVRLEKYEGDDADARAADPDAAADDVYEAEDNLLLIGGASAIWQRLISTSITAFDNSNAHLGVGDSTTAAADTQTDLQAASNKVRKAMDTTYPLHTDSTGTSGSKSIVYRSTFGTGDANFAWQEWALFNAAAAGRAFNRKVESMGTKTSAASWVLTVTLALA